MHHIFKIMTVPCLSRFRVILFNMQNFREVEYHLEYAEAIQFTDFECGTIVISQFSDMNAPYSLFT